MKSSFPRISFGMIVLNGQPFLRYNILGLYPFAHQIIVVEGASPGSTNIASEYGHSIDGTLEELKYIKKHNDPEDKLIIVTAEDEGHPNGFWPGEKHEQSMAYAKRVTGDYLWQVDVDEFYRSQDIQNVMSLLVDESRITAVSFKMLTFWGGFDYIVEGHWISNFAKNVHRLFKWAPGYEYVTHRPPTVVDDKGIDLRKQWWFTGEQTERLGIFLYHYSLVFPKQVKEKCAYYQSADWSKRSKAEQWANEVFMNLSKPYRVHNVYQHLSWLERKRIEHPEPIELLREDLARGIVDTEQRHTYDIELLLNKWWYRLGINILKMINPIVRIIEKTPILRGIWYRINALVSV